MEVKAIERWGADWQNVVVGELLTVAKHPNADRLSLTTVRVGDGEPLVDRVRGHEHRARPARAGGPARRRAARRPADRADREDGRRQQRHALLGRRARPDLRRRRDPHPAAPGRRSARELADLYGDMVLDVDVKPNRGDALSLVGLAREVSATTGAPVRFPAIELVERGDRRRPTASRSRSTSPSCAPGSSAGSSAAFTVGPSPDQVQMRLQAAGMRPVSNVVDASNYVMLELGKPTHTFDCGRSTTAGSSSAGPVAGRAPRDARPRRAGARSGDAAHRRSGRGAGHRRGHGRRDERGQPTRRRRSSSSRPIFDPVSIRRTGQRYALRSEASLRFEKGQEFRLARIGADRVAQLIVAWAGGEVAPGRVDTAPVEPEPARVAFRPARVNRLLGTELDRRGPVGVPGAGGRRDRARSGPGATIPVARGGRPLDVPADGTGPDRDRADLAGRPGHRGRHRRGGRPGRRLRVDRADAPGHRDAALPPGPDGRPRRRPRGARRGRASPRS